ncbi:HAD-IA family hydrolase [Streptomyces sp. NPDC051976]|uniref:HAD family hydrolase n=1 Tax=Streptomyces sp. NPDC051976 TaxID=3154947 RepID=UPI003418D818
MTIKACMFDFSGTLFRVESCERWLRAVLADEGIAATDAEVTSYAQLLNDAGALPGGAWPRTIPPHLERLCAARDLGAAQHRAAYTGLSRTAALPWDIHDALYDRHMTPDAWRPYPDTAPVLAELRGRGVPVAVVSNIGWDLRPVFRAHGLAELVDAFVLSYEVGAQKPDPRIFRTACDLLGVPPERTLMVGDDRRADAGAAALGCSVHLVDHLPVADRPDALRGVLGLLA